MIVQIIFTISAFLLYIYILLFKLIRKNDTTYLVLLGLQSLGILLNLLKINYGILHGILWNIVLVLLCIAIPLLVIIIEYKKVNVSEIIKIALAKSFIKINKEKQAKKILIDLVRKNNNSYIGYKMLGDLYEKNGGTRKAIIEYVQALEIRKNDYNTYYKIAILLNKLDKKYEAKEMLQNLLKNRPQMVEASELLGEIYIKEKEFKQAIEIYTNAIKYVPDNYQIYYNLGVCYSRINDFDIARKCFQKAVELKEDYYIAYYRLGQIALLYRDFENAEENFAKSLYTEKETNEKVKEQYIQTQEEIDIDNYLKETYNLTKGLDTDILKI